MRGIDLPTGRAVERVPVTPSRCLGSLALVKVEKYAKSNGASDEIALAVDTNSLRRIECDWCLVGARGPTSRCGRCFFGRRAARAVLWSPLRSPVLVGDAAVKLCNALDALSRFDILDSAYIFHQSQSQLPHCAPVVSAVSADSRQPRASGEPPRERRREGGCGV